ncbi:MAG: iron-sulfur cluster insertion protein ErpA [Magnetococcales bacterium]|nr:iron-sulfur cluster insertion protein ErpA [Magnetococcales bacterium]PPR18506.1 MAG: Iron-sulfur cluster insertion protein ErpA [Pseudomonadota bacterium]
MVKINFDLPEEPKENASTEETLTLTEKAAKRILEIIEKKGEQNLVLRLSVMGGGCSGYSYNFKLTQEKAPSDISIKNESVTGAEVVIDVMSFSYLKGSTIDFEETLEASQFIVNNPNATTSCGCGSSFSL